MALVKAAEVAEIAVMKRERRTTDRDGGLKWALALGVVFVVLATVAMIALFVADPAMFERATW